MWTSIWAFLQDPGNRAVLGWIGGGIVVIAGGLWAAFKFFFSKRPSLSADEGGNGAWFDKDRSTGAAGFAAGSLPYFMRSPLKRWWFENWFQPIARIGKTGNYEHVLRPAAPLPRSCPPKQKSLSSSEIPKPLTASQAKIIAAVLGAERSFPISQQTRLESFSFTSMMPFWFFPD
jgi:hypothetical protein